MRSVEERVRSSDRPPMVPVISRDPQFLFASDLEVAQFAKNGALVAQLCDSLRCWISHADEVCAALREAGDAWDCASHLDMTAVRARLVELERDAAFHDHFARHEIAACLRVLRGVKGAPTLDAELATLAVLLEQLRTDHATIRQTLEFVEMLHSVLASPTAGAGALAPGATEEAAEGQPPNVPTHWGMADCADALPPFFSALRALWLTSPLLGEAQAHRFAALVRWVVRRVESSIARACGGAIDRLVDSIRCAAAVKNDLVGAQDAAVTLQEEFHGLRERLVSIASTAATSSSVGELVPSGVGAVASSSAGGSSSSGASPATALERGRALYELDDGALFAVVEWQYGRCTELLEVVDALLADPEKLGSALTDPISHVNLMDPNAIGNDAFHRCAQRIIHGAAPSAEAILQRMQVAASSPERAPAAKIPFDRLTTSLMLNLSFNPPVVTAIGGPLSEGALEALCASLPTTCLNTAVVSHRAEHRPPRWVRLGPGVQRLVIHGQFCDTDVAQVHFMSALLSIIELEDAWKMTDTHAVLDGDQEVHMLHFRKHRSTEKAQR